MKKIIIGLLFLPVVAFAAVHGDINHDNRVDDADRAILADAYGSCTGDTNYNADADINSDGCVDVADLGDFATNFGTIETTTTSSVASDWVAPPTPPAEDYCHTIDVGDGFLHLYKGYEWVGIYTREGFDLDTACHF